MRIPASAALLLLAASALAQPPFQIAGLHPDLVFTDAVAMTGKLGGQCRVKQSRTEGGGVSAQCKFPPRVGGDGAPDIAAPAPSIGSQPVVGIGMEATVESAQLTRIVFVFDGSLDAVADFLVQQYGQPDHGGTPSTEQSWSHSRRRGWSEGNYTLGLLNSPDLVILTANRPSREPGAP